MGNPCIDALSDAMKNTRRVLFRPLDRKKWLYLAFIYLLAGGSGGSGGGGGGSSPGHGHSGHGALSDLPDWLRKFLSDLKALEGLAVVLTTIAVIGVLALFILLVYVNCVFQFIFIQCVVENRILLGEYWHRFKHLGFSYLLWIIGCIVAATAALMITFGVPIALLYPSASSGALPLSAKIILIILGICIFIFMLFVMSMIGVITRDLVIPIMIGKEQSVIGAWKLLLPSMRANPMQVLLYFLMKMAIGVGMALISLFAVLVALVICGIVFGLPALLVYLLLTVAHIAASPAIVFIGAFWVMVALLALIFITAVIVLPAGIYERSYNLAFLGRLNDDFMLLPVLDMDN
jgi:hypothetical protein